MLRKFLSVLLLCLPLWACAEGVESEFTEGVEYVAVVPALPDSSEGKVKVVELFWYGCPHCFQFEPHLQRWVDNKPENVDFERIPAVFKKRDGSVNAHWEIMARAYYTADVMGVLDKIHHALFDALHVKRERLFGQEELREFFVTQGVSAEEFDATFESFAVNGLVANAIRKTEQYGISGVPALAVDGKYRINTDKAESFGRIIDIMDYLIARESGSK